MAKHKIILIFATLVFSLASAHEFWLAPNKYFFKVGESVTISPSVGEGFKAEPWQNAQKRTLWVKYFSIQKGEIQNQSLVVTDKGGMAFTPPHAGNYLVGLQSHPSYIELEGYKFEEYLKEDGLDNIAQYRLVHNDTAKRSREFYQRCVKTLIQVGDTHTEAYKIKTHTALEITPLTNPYALKLTDSLAVLIEFKGSPCVNQTVVSWCKSMDSLKNKTTYKTNTQGFVIIPVKQKGEWMISTVKMELFADTTRADYESFWGSYTFAVK